jgi:hypothetical protein
MDAIFSEAIDRLCSPTSEWASLITPLRERMAEAAWLGAAQMQRQTDWDGKETALMVLDQAREFAATIEMALNEATKMGLDLWLSPWLTTGEP